MSRVESILVVLLSVAYGVAFAVAIGTIDVSDAPPEVTRGRLLAVGVGGALVLFGPPALAPLACRARLRARFILAAALLPGTALVLFAVLGAFPVPSSGIPLRFSLGYGAAGSVFLVPFVLSYLRLIRPRRSRAAA